MNEQQRDFFYRLERLKRSERKHALRVKIAETTDRTAKHELQAILDDLVRKELLSWVLGTVVFLLVATGGLLFSFAAYGNRTHEASTQEKTHPTQKQVATSETSAASHSSTETKTAATVTEVVPKELDLNEEEVKGWVSAVLNQEFTNYPLPKQYDLQVSISTQDNLVYIDANLGDLFSGYADYYQLRINAQGELEQSSTEDGWNLVSTSYMDLATADHLPKIEPEADLLAGYSDLEIEYARVWLATNGPEAMNVYGFHLQASVSPSGTPIDPYDEGSVTFPVETTYMDGGGSVYGLVTYASNHDGTITVYPVPSHWQMPAEKASDEAYIHTITQEILDTSYTLAVPTGDDELVAQLIDTMNERY